MDETERSLNLGQVQANTQALVAGLKKRRGIRKENRGSTYTSFCPNLTLLFATKRKKKNLSLYNDRTVLDLFLIALNVT